MSDRRPSVSEMSTASRRSNLPDGPLESKVGERKPGALDRQTTTPMYVKMYCRLHGHHRLEEFERGTVPADDELIIYTWKDATLKELTGLIKDVFEDACRKDAKFSFRNYYQPAFAHGRWFSKDLGLVYNARPTFDDQTTLESKKYRQGDVLDVAIHYGPGGIAPPEYEDHRPPQ